MTTDDYPTYADSEDRQVALRQIMEDAQVKRYEAQMKAETEKARLAAASAQDRREHRRVFWGYFGAGLAVVAVILGITGGIVYGTTRPDPVDQTPKIEQEREAQCLGDGGGWVPADLIEGSGSGLCVYPGQPVQSS